VNTDQRPESGGEGLEEILAAAHDDLLRHVRTLADSTHAIAAIMDRLPVLDDAVAEPRPLLVSPAQAAAAIRMRLAVQEEQAALARSRTHCVAILEGLDYVLNRLDSWRPAADWWRPGNRAEEPVIPAELQSLADRVFFTACPDEADLELFTEEERDYLAGEPVRTLLPGVAHALEIEKFHLESAASDLRDATEVYGKIAINPWHLRRARVAVKNLVDVIGTTAGIIDALAAAIGLTIIDASGIDLSALRLTDVGILDGVRWTRTAAYISDTIWPDGLTTVRVLENSAEIAPGVYQVRLGTQEVPNEHVRA
jgi:hypothetical protein